MGVRKFQESGEVLDYLGNQSRYMLKFSSSCQPGTEAFKIRLDINQTMFNENGQDISNDYLGNIMIYNANNSEAFQMTSNYSLTINWKNNSSTPYVMPDLAQYSAQYQQSVYRPSNATIPIGLYNITSIDFAKAA